MNKSKIASVIFLLLFWLVTSGCYLLLSQSIAAALCHPGIQVG